MTEGSTTPGVYTLPRSSAGLGPGGVKEEIVWDALGEMRGFLEGIFKQGRDRREGGGLGIVNGSTGSSGVVAGSDSKKGGNSAGMITVIARYLSGIRWALVHEGSRVPRGLLKENEAVIL